MNNIARKFQVIEGGSSIAEEKPIADPIEDTLRTLEKWLFSRELASIADIDERNARKAISSRRWRGVELEVREVEIGRGGAGGKAPQVHVDSLPTDLRQAWYLQHGINLHEKRDPVTGQTVLIPENSFAVDARHEERLRVARWRHDVIRPVLALPKGTGGRGERVRLVEQIVATERTLPDGARGHVTRPTLYRWIKDYEQDGAGLAGLMDKESSRKGKRFIMVTKAWDDFFAPHISPEDHREIGDALTHYIRSLWASGLRGKNQVSEQATTRLIEVSRKLRVVDFDRLDLGRPVKQSGCETQFEVCFVNPRRVSEERKFGMIAVKNKDNARWEDEFMPHIRRDYSGYKPRDIVVGDVHPTDVKMVRADGSEVYPKAISWFDIATNEIHMTFVLCEKGEGVKREHIAMAFEAMVAEWGLPRLLYLDNGSEYKWAEMISGFTKLSKMTTGAFGIHDLGDNPEVAERVAGSREAVIRSLTYNAKGKPGIEGAFGNIEKVQFAVLPGWTSGDRMRKKTHAKGKEAKPFPGTAVDFLDAAGIMLDNYHKRSQSGKLDGKSPNEALNGFIDQGWGKTVLGNPDVLRLAFAEEHERTPRSGRVQYKSRHGDVTFYYHDALTTIHHPVTIRVPAWRPDAVFCFDGDRFICAATPEQTYGVLERAGAGELGRRRKYVTREIAEMRKHCALLDLVAETARHNSWLPDTPDAPVASVIDTGMLGRLEQAETQARIAAAETKPRREPSQWGTGPNAALAAVTYADEDL